MRELTARGESLCEFGEPQRVPTRPSALSLLFFALSLKSCIVYPKFAPKHEEPNCRLISRSLRLDSALLQGGSCGSDLQTCLLGIILIGGASTLVSGSVVLVGNTLHWLERKGRCPEERAPEERAPEERAPEERAPEERAPEERAPEEQ